VTGGKTKPKPSSVVTTATGGAWTIIGIDCATQEERMGLARGLMSESGALSVERVTLGTAGESAAASVSQWIRGQARFVVAFDAPLGWPRRLGEALVKHVAGAPLAPGSDDQFRRQTDRLVQKTLGKMPPDVGADRIARTARAALTMLAAVRELADKPVPLAWKQAQDSGVIEVYPAATLITRGVSGVGYKAGTAQGRKARGQILTRLASEIDIKTTRELMIEDANLFDAMVCVLAGADFARGQCIEPPDDAQATKEGFIWFRGTGQRSLFPTK
jgi:predicted RNase H-like nuclease